MVLKEVNTYLYPRSRSDLMGVQGLDWEVTALNACQAPFDVVCHICFHPGPIDTCSGQGQCLVDSCMALVEICHDAVSAGQWNYHSFSLEKEFILNGDVISEVPLKSGGSGDTSTSVWPTIQGQSVGLLTGWSLTESLPLSWSGSSWWRWTWIWHWLWGPAGSLCWSWKEDNWGHQLGVSPYLACMWLPCHTAGV